MKKYYEIIEKLIKEDKITFKQGIELIESVVADLVIPIVQKEVEKQTKNGLTNDDLNRIWRQIPATQPLTYPGDYPTTDPYYKPGVIYANSNSIMSHASFDENMLDSDISAKTQNMFENVINGADLANNMQMNVSTTDVK